MRKWKGRASLVHVGNEGGASTWKKMFSIDLIRFRIMLHFPLHRSHATAGSRSEVDLCAGYSPAYDHPVRSFLFILFANLLNL